MQIMRRSGRSDDFEFALLGFPLQCPQSELAESGRGHTGEIRAV